MKSDLLGKTTTDSMDEMLQVCIELPDLKKQSLLNRWVVREANYQSPRGPKPLPKRRAQQSLRHACLKAI